MILMLLNPLDHLQETLIPPSLIKMEEEAGEEHQEETVAHTFHYPRKVKDKATKAPTNYANEAVNRYTDEQQMPSSFTGLGYCNWSYGSD